MAVKHEKKEVVRYITKQIEAGRSIDHVKQSLMQYGHSSEELDKMISDVLNQEEAEEKKRSKTATRAIEILYVIVFAIFIFWVGTSSSSPGEAIIFGFSPTLLYILITIILLEKMKDSDGILAALPVALAFAFFIIGTIGSMPPFNNMEVGKLTLLNLVFSYFFLLIIKYSEYININIESAIEKGISKIEGNGDEDEDEEEYHPQQEFQQAQEPRSEMHIAPPRKEEFIEIVQQEDKESVSKLIQSIESNCKALNSVIGRVYRKSNGGTSLMRALIEVRKEWYNEFNTIDMEHDKERVIQVIDKIEKRLNHLFRTEKELFGDVHVKNLKRDLAGHSRLIDILITNDNDPVETYFENALSLCGKVREKAMKS